MPPRARIRPLWLAKGELVRSFRPSRNERRQMLEEAAGISGLHVRRKDAEQKLRAAETNLARLATILADMDARAGQLRRQAKQAERYRKLAKRSLQAEARLIFVRWQEAKAAADAATCGGQCGFGRGRKGWHRAARIDRQATGRRARTGRGALGGDGGARCGERFVQQAGATNRRARPHHPAAGRSVGAGRAHGRRWRARRQTDA